MGRAEIEHRYKPHDDGAVGQGNAGVHVAPYNMQRYVDERMFSYYNRKDNDLG
jgi:hypothetical protein